MSLENIRKYDGFVFGAVALSLVVGFFAGSWYMAERVDNITKVVAGANAEGTENDDVDVSLRDFWQAWSLLQSKYPFTQPEIDDKMNGAIIGLVDSYDDPYTKFFPPQEAKSFKEEIDGSFAGVGIEIDVINGVLTVVSPLDGTPGFLAGILTGDAIVKIDDVETLDMSINTAVTYIRGEVGTDVVLTMFREGESDLLPITVTRDQIQVPIIKVTKTEDGLDVIRLLSFTNGSARQFTQSVVDIEKGGALGVIIDLRNNPGGILGEAVDIANLFLDKGVVVVSENQGDETTYEYKTKRGIILKDNFQVVVLVNGGSASASEILAGALQDYDRAVIVGDTTFGKGSVQELINVGKKGSSLKVTVAHWLTPSGRTINETGLEPDIMVTMTSDDIENNNDVQLKEAVRLLQEKISSSTTITKSPEKTADE